MSSERVFCGGCKRIFYDGQGPTIKRTGKMPRHQTIDFDTGEKTGQWCEHGVAMLRTIPDALPTPCFVCAAPMAGKGRVEDGYGTIRYASQLMDLGTGGLVPVTTSGDNRSHGVICPDCMAAGKKRVDEAWGAIVEKAPVVPEPVPIVPGGGGSL